MVGAPGYAPELDLSTLSPIGQLPIKWAVLG
jgi:hypothetical protein